MFYTPEGYITYRGLRTMQNQLAFPLIEALLTRERFRHVIEIGTARGGTTLFLADLADRLQFQLISYDIARHWHNEDLARRNVCVLRSCFDEDTQLEVAACVSRGKTLVMCDGAEKAREVNTYAPLLAAGDMIMAHDYASDPECFRERVAGTYWDWLEITDDDLAVPAGRLSKFEEVDLWKAAWGCWRIVSGPGS